MALLANPVAPFVLNTRLVRRVGGSRWLWFRQRHLLPRMSSCKCLCRGRLSGSAGFFGRVTTFVYCVICLRIRACAGHGRVGDFSVNLLRWLVCGGSGIVGLMPDR